MKKKIIKMLGLSCCLALLLSGCSEFEGVDYLNAGHPALPDASTGKTAKMSRALVPENLNVRPELGSVGSVSPSRPAPVAASPMNHRGSH